MFRIINNLKNRKGFTLIELIVVLAVLAIILAIAIPRFLGVLEESKLKADRATYDLILKAAELYFAQNPDTDEVDINDLPIVVNWNNDDYDPPVKASIDEDGIVTLDEERP